MRVLIIAFLFGFVVVLGMISGFLSVDHGINKCVKQSPSFKGWKTFYTLGSVNLNWPDIERTCQAYYDSNTKQIVPSASPSPASE
jgi:hypothetical protein